MNKTYLGIDTSNYKTSIAIVDDNNQILFEKSELLSVKQGERGLRQSDAFFKHANTLPDFINEVFNHVDPSTIGGIAYSSRPRRVEGSYMPVFLAGENLAKTLSSTLKATIKDYSHQEGHIEAVLSTSEVPDIDKFIMFHLSGGTTEFLLCERDDNGFKTDIIGGTKDISIGQLLDRLGVRAGLSFPSGAYLDEIAISNTVSNKCKKIKFDNGYFNLSGIETDLLNRLDEGESLEEIVPGLFEELSSLLQQSADFLSKEYDVRNVFLAGGVASSSYIRARVSGVEWGDARLSGDNAVGIARLGRRYFNK